MFRTKIQIPMKKVLKKNEAGAYVTPAGQEYPLVVKLVEDFAILAPWNRDGSASYTRIAGDAVAPGCFVFDAKFKLYVAAVVDKDTITVSDFDKGGSPKK